MLTVATISTDQTLLFISSGGSTSQNSLYTAGTRASSSVCNYVKRPSPRTQDSMVECAHIAVSGSHFQEKKCLVVHSFDPSLIYIDGYLEILLPTHKHAQKKHISSEKQRDRCAPSQGHQH